MNTTTYTVTTRDVDGSSTKSYKSLKGARKRFEEMLGRTLEAAIEWQAEEQQRAVPAVENVRYVRAVSDYGTVVVFKRIVRDEFGIEVEEPAPVATAPAAVEPLTLADSTVVPVAALASTRTPAQRRRAQNGMHVNLAGISATYLAVFGEKHPEDMAYKSAAEKVREARPEDWDLLFAYAMEVVGQPNGGYPTYATSSAAIRDKFNLGA